MPSSKVRNKGQVTIPTEIRQQAHIEEGTLLEFDVVDDGVLLRPLMVVDSADAWFWSQEWQSGEREAQAEIAAGEGDVYTDEEFTEALKQR